MTCDRPCGRSRRRPPDNPWPPGSREIAESRAVRCRPTRARRLPTFARRARISTAGRRMSRAQTEQPHVRAGAVGGHRCRQAWLDVASSADAPVRRSPNDADGIASLVPTCVSCAAAGGSDATVGTKPRDDGTVAAGLACQGQPAPGARLRRDALPAMPWRVCLFAPACTAAAPAAHACAAPRCFPRALLWRTAEHTAPSLPPVGALEPIRRRPAAAELMELPDAAASPVFAGICCTASPASDRRARTLLGELPDLVPLHRLAVGSAPVPRRTRQLSPPGQAAHRLSPLPPSRPHPHPLSPAFPHPNPPACGSPASSPRCPVPAAQLVIIATAILRVVPWPPPHLPNPVSPVEDGRGGFLLVAAGRSPFSPLRADGAGTRDSLWAVRCRALCCWCVSPSPVSRGPPCPRSPWQQLRETFRPVRGAARVRCVGAAHRPSGARAIRRPGAAGLRRACVRARCAVALRRRRSRRALCAPPGGAHLLRSAAAVVLLVAARAAPAIVPPPWAALVVLASAALSATSIPVSLVRVPHQAATVAPAPERPGGAAGPAASGATTVLCDRPRLLGSRAVAVLTRAGASGRSASARRHLRVHRPSAAIGASVGARAGLCARGVRVPTSAPSALAASCCGPPRKTRRRAALPPPPADR